MHHSSFTLSPSVCFFGRLVGVPDSSKIRSSLSSRLTRDPIPSVFEPILHLLSSLRCKFWRFAENKLEISLLQSKERMHMKCWLDAWSLCKIFWLVLETKNTIISQSSSYNKNYSILSFIAKAPKQPLIEVVKAARFNNYELIADVLNAINLLPDVKLD
nr:10803_t:CDS:2 [Entrophospora candida]